MLKERRYSPKTCLFFCSLANYIWSEQNVCAVSLLEFVSKRPVYYSQEERLCQWTYGAKKREKEKQLRVGVGREVEGTYSLPPPSFRLFVICSPFRTTLRHYNGAPPYSHPVNATTPLLRPYSVDPNVKILESFHYFEGNITTRILWPNDGRVNGIPLFLNAWDKLYWVQLDGITSKSTVFHFSSSQKKWSCSETLTCMTLARVR